MKRFLLSAAIAAAAVMVATSAFAAPNVVVTKDTYLYKKATGNTVVGEVDEGEELEVTSCGDKRCKVKMSGPDPYIRKDRIEEIDPEDDDDDDGDGKPGISLGITIGPNGPGISIGVGSGKGGVSVDAGTGPTKGPRVCLFDLDNYGGAGRCFGPGTNINLDTVGWNDAANSVRVYGGAGAQICEHNGGGGACANFTTNTATLGGYNDTASYIDVY